MHTIQYIYLYAMTVPVFFAIDLLWLGVIARGFYQEQLGAFLGEVQWVPAIIFYLLYIGGILLFAVAPGLRAGSFMTTLVLGAAFGFLAYATYDLTNLATLKDWPLTVSIVDMLWGTILTASVASASYYLATRFIL